MTTNRPICGFREGVQAHLDAGEALCGPCQRSAARRRWITARNRVDLARVDAEEGFESLADADLAGTFEESMHRGWSDGA